MSRRSTSRRMPRAVSISPPRSRRSEGAIARLSRFVFGGDLTAAQIAEVLELKTNAVEVALHRALARLRHALEAGACSARLCTEHGRCLGRAFVIGTRAGVGLPGPTLRSNSGLTGRPVRSS